MTSIFVAKLDFGITNDLLKQAFQEYGTVLKASVATDRETGKSRGFGFVEMADRDEALNAIKSLDGSLMNGRPIAVKEAEQRTDSRPPRDSNAPRPDFNRNREASSAPRPERTPDFPRPDGDDAPSFVAPLANPFKTEIRKKSDKDKKTLDRDSDNRAKKPKMDAYKKSGKNNRFFGDDDDDGDDWDINSSNDIVDNEYDDEEDYDDEDED